MALVAASIARSDARISGFASANAGVSQRASTPSAIGSTAPALRTAAQIVYGDRNWSTNVVGTTLAYWTVRNWPIERGSAWEPHDEVMKSKVVVLGSTRREQLFGAREIALVAQNAAEVDERVNHSLRRGSRRLLSQRQRMVKGGPGPRQIATPLLDGTEAVKHLHK